MYPFHVHRFTGIIITIFFDIVNRFCAIFDDFGKVLFLIP